MWAIIVKLKSLTDHTFHPVCKRFHVNGQKLSRGFFRGILLLLLLLSTSHVTLKNLPSFICTKKISAFILPSRVDLQSFRSAAFQPTLHENRRSRIRNVNTHSWREKTHLWQSKFKINYRCEESIMREAKLEMAFRVKIMARLSDSSDAILLTDFLFLVLDSGGLWFQWKTIVRRFSCHEAF